MTKVAFISVYGTKCGIATYNAELISRLKDFCEIKIFAEYSDTPSDDENVIRCWDRNSYNKKDLLKGIKEYNPDIIHISHEYGLFPKSYLFTLLMTQLHQYHTVVTLHSVYDHKDKVVQEAMIDHIICHSENAKKCLENKGILSDINIIPHGIKNFLPDHELLSGLWNTWGTQTIVHPGFLLGYKGHSRMLDIVKELIVKYPEMQYVILGSENELNQKEHDFIYNQLMQKIEKLNLENNVTIKRGFVSEDVLFSYIRTASVIVLPYQPHPDHNVYASSGIARLTLATKVPLVVSDAHLFDDIKFLVPHSENDEELEDYISNYFIQGGINEEETINRKQFLKQNDWSEIARLTHNVYKKILLSN